MYLHKVLAVAAFVSLTSLSASIAVAQSTPQKTTAAKPAAAAAAGADKAPATAPSKTAGVQVMFPMKWLGEVAQEDGVTTITNKRFANMVIGNEQSSDYVIEFEFKVNQEQVPITIVPFSVAPHNDNAAGQTMIIIRKPKTTGNVAFYHQPWNKEEKSWRSQYKVVPGPSYPVKPDPDNARAVAAWERDVPSYLLDDHWIKLRCHVSQQAITLWMDDDYFLTIPTEAVKQGQTRIRFQQGLKIRNFTISPALAPSKFIPLNLSNWMDGKPASNVNVQTIDHKGVPFMWFEQGQKQLDLSNAVWPEAGVDPANYNERYDNGPLYQFDKRQPTFNVPADDYTALHLLAVAKDDTALTPNMTLRAGHFSSQGQALYYDFPVTVPTEDELAKLPDALKAMKGKLVHVRIPMDVAFGQDLGDIMQLSLTKEIRLARRRPDPARFRFRPLGLPSGVQIAAATLEQSPVKFSVTSKATGHAFVAPQKADFDIKLISRVDNAQQYKLTATATYDDGQVFTSETTGKLDANGSKDVTLNVPTTRLGYHDVAIELAIDGKPLMTRYTSFATLPKDTRKHRETSPFGTWDFSGGHYTSRDADVIGSLYEKLGLRYGMFNFTAEQRAKWGVRQGTEFKGDGSKESYDKYLERSPDALPVFLLLHEDAVSGGHITRVPDIFHDRPPYVMNETEQTRFKYLYDYVIKAAKGVREINPEIQLRLGNGGLPTKEELLRQKIPADLFDALGNESGSFGRFPETQPPDWVANNAGLWMDHELLKAYGYEDKPVVQCYEICYPSTNPGNLSPQTQADYLVRHAIHSLAWKIPQVRIGIISDTGNSYRFSNWGASGLTRPYPELSVKPSFVSVATMTRMLDGATYDKKIDLDSLSLYAVQLQSPDKKPIQVLWTLRGQRELQLDVTGNNWSITDGQGETKKLTSNNGKIAITLSPSPVYLTSDNGSIQSPSVKTPEYVEKPVGEVKELDALSSTDNWKLNTERDYVLEYHDFMTPRRKGEYKVEAVDSFEGQKGALRITPQPIDYGKDTMPMYGVLKATKDIALPGKPTELGVWVNGNSGWGRIIFEFKDASGQTWTSIGAPQAGDLSPWMLDWMPAAAVKDDERTATAQSDWNTDDVFGDSRINFDGWRYVGIKMPGHYPGEQYPTAPASQWRYDKDGVVHYPIALTSIIVELSTKVLHLTDYVTIPRPEIYLRNLVVAQDDTTTVKQTKGEWTP